MKNLIWTGNPVFPLMNRIFEAAPPGWGPECAQRWDRGHGPGKEERSIQNRLSQFRRLVLWDHYQRFGPAIFLIALGGLIGRRRQYADGALLGLAGGQCLIWLSATHLYARFAIVLLIPLALLAGRAAEAPKSATRWHWMVGLLLAGSAWNLVHAAKLHREEAFPAAPASWFYDGLVPGYEYLGAVNRDLPAQAKILLVGEARAFYFRRKVDYGVVFNRNPFVETVQASSQAEEVLRWLRGNGYTHVLVHWGEIERLSATYGFAPEITPERFARLAEAGLRRWRAFPHPRDARRYVEIYAVGE